MLLLLVLQQLPDENFIKIGHLRKQVYLLLIFRVYAIRKFYLHYLLLLLIIFLLFLQPVLIGLLAFGLLLLPLSFKVQLVLHEVKWLILLFKGNDLTFLFFIIFLAILNAALLLALLVLLLLYLLLLLLSRLNYFIFILFLDFFKFIPEFQLSSILLRAFILFIHSKCIYMLNFFFISFSKLNIYLKKILHA